MLYFLISKEFAVKKKIMSGLMLGHSESHALIKKCCETKQEYGGQHAWSKMVLPIEMYAAQSAFCCEKYVSPECILVLMHLLVGLKRFADKGWKRQFCYGIRPRL